MSNIEETIITPEDPVIITPTVSPQPEGNGASTPYSTITEPSSDKVDVNDPSIKLTRIMRIGEYKPLRYATSAPPLPEGYVFDMPRWEELVSEARRVEKIVNGIKLTPEEEAIQGKHTQIIEKQRIADLENRKYEDKPVTFWEKMKMQANHIVSDISYCANKLYASAKDEVKKETLEQAFIRFNNLDLTPKEIDASGPLLCGYYCRAVIEMPSETTGNMGKTASGWLLITEKLVIFDGDRVHLPNVTIEGNGKHRFSFQLAKIASFGGALWKTSTIGTSAGEVPTFTPIGNEVAEDETHKGSDDDVIEKKRMQQDRQNMDAICVFDQTGCVHQFWDFKSYFGNADDVLSFLNCAWRSAMLK